MRWGGWHVLENAISLADLRRNRTDREDVVRRLVIFDAQDGTPFQLNQIPDIISLSNN